MQHKARIRSINLTLSLSFIINSNKRGGRYLSNGRTKVSDLCEITPILETPLNSKRIDSLRNGESSSKSVDFPSFLDNSRSATQEADREKTWPNIMEHSGSRARAHTRTHTRAHSASARPRTVWVLVIKCITRLVYTESGPRNLQSRLVCRFNRTLLGTEFMARPMVYNSETRLHVQEAATPMEFFFGIYFRFGFSESSVR